MKIRLNHDMTREHYISFITFLSGDTLVLRKLYPEWNAETRIQKLSHGIVLWYCINHGLYYKTI